jgi:hypothetical protein
LDRPCRPGNPRFETAAGTGHAERGRPARFSRTRAIRPCSRAGRFSASKAGRVGWLWLRCSEGAKPACGRWFPCRAPGPASCPVWAGSDSGLPHTQL